MVQDRVRGGEDVPAWEASAAQVEAEARSWRKV